MESTLEQMYVVTKLLLNHQLETLLGHFNLDKSLALYLEANESFQICLKSNLDYLNQHNGISDEDLYTKMKLISLIEQFAKFFSSDRPFSDLVFLKKRLLDFKEPNEKLSTFIEAIQLAIEQFLDKNAQYFAKTQKSKFASSEMEAKIYESFRLQVDEDLYNQVKDSIQQLVDTTDGLSLLSKISKGMSSAFFRNADFELELIDHFSSFVNMYKEEDDFPDTPKMTRDEKFFSHVKTEVLEEIMEEFIDDGPGMDDSEEYNDPDPAIIDNENYNFESENFPINIEPSTSNTQDITNIWTDSQIHHLIASKMLNASKMSNWRQIHEQFKSVFKDKTHKQLHSKYDNLKRSNKLKLYQKQADFLYKKYKSPIIRHPVKIESKSSLVWSEEEICHLLAGVKLFGTQWKTIGAYFKSIILRDTTSMQNKYASLMKKTSRTLSPFTARVNQIYEQNKNKQVKLGTITKWTELEVAHLHEGVGLFGQGNWKQIWDQFSETFKERTTRDLCNKYRHIMSMQQKQESTANNANLVHISKIKRKKRKGHGWGR